MTAGENPADSGHGIISSIGVEGRLPRGIRWCLVIRSVRQTAHDRNSAPDSGDSYNGPAKGGGYCYDFRPATVFLQPQFPGAILPEQAPVSNVAPHHLNRPMSGLVHD
jgi:hypothetical protein